MVALDVEDVAFVQGGTRVTIQRSKTDQEGQGAVFGVPTAQHPQTCATAWLRRWLQASGIEHGAIFRMVDAQGRVRSRRLALQSVGVIVKRHADRIGLDLPSYSAHSLRAGFAASAASGGAQTLRIARPREVALDLGAAGLRVSGRLARRPGREGRKRTLTTSPFQTAYRPGTAHRRNRDDQHVAFPSTSKIEYCFDQSSGHCT